MQFTDKHIANLREAIKMWETVPPENVARKLETWRSDNYIPNKPPTCNTLACFGGWVAWWPAFMALGVRPGLAGAPVLGDEEDFGVSHVLFGANLFLWRDDRDGPGTDHAVVMRRLRKTLTRALAERKEAA